MKKEKIDKITQYWATHAAYDLETASALFKSSRYLYA